MLQGEETHQLQLQWQEQERHNIKKLGDGWGYFSDLLNDIVSNGQYIYSASDILNALNSNWQYSYGATPRVPVLSEKTVSLIGKAFGMSSMYPSAEVSSLAKLMALLEADSRQVRGQVVQSIIIMISSN